MRRKIIDHKYERKTFNSKLHIIHTHQYKIYVVPRDVYSYENKYIINLEVDQFKELLMIMKYPNDFYHDKVDKYINQLIAKLI